MLMALRLSLPVQTDLKEKIYTSIWSYQFNMPLTQSLSRISLPDVVLLPIPPTPAIGSWESPYEALNGLQTINCGEWITSWRVLGGVDFRVAPWDELPL